MKYDGYYMKIQYSELTNRIRHDILTITTTAGSGHPTSSLSAVEVMTVLFFGILHYDMSDPKNPVNDRVIFSKGHASPLYYALYAAAGVISNDELLRYRTFDSVLEGHPTSRFPYTEAATGSLGQGLSIGLGEALALKLQFSESKSQKDETYIPRVFVLAGDGEMAEGSMWEAAAAASLRKVNNLFLIVDINRLGQSDPTMYGHDISVFANRFEAFGWRVITVEQGNDIDSVQEAWEIAEHIDERPTVLLVKTRKGAGISFLEDKDGWHGKPLSKDELTKALRELGDVNGDLHGEVKKPQERKLINSASVQVNEQPSAEYLRNTYVTGKSVATRKAFGNAIKRLGSSHSNLVVLDGDTKNSTYTEFFGKAFPDRFFELYIAEQNMAGAGVGFSARGFYPVISSFACFLTRAADQIRMAAFSGATMLVNGSHAGVSIGEDGPSQMGLEDLAQFRAVHGSTVLYPSDAISTERLTELALSLPGVTYIRTSRPETPLLYTEKDEFHIGGSRMFLPPNAQTPPTITIVAAGVTLHEALSAQRLLTQEGIFVSVLDCYSVKPIDTQALQGAAKTSRLMVVVEDHYKEGGLGEAVLSAISGGTVLPRFIHLCVEKTPRSGKAAQLLSYEGIDAASICAKVKESLV